MWMISRTRLKKRSKSNLTASSKELMISRER